MADEGLKHAFESVELADIHIDPEGRVVIVNPDLVAKLNAAGLAGGGSSAPPKPTAQPSLPTAGSGDWPKNIGCCSIDGTGAGIPGAIRINAAADWPKNVGCCSSPQDGLRRDSPRDAATSGRGASDDWPKNVGCCSRASDSARDTAAGRGAGDWPKNVGCCSSPQDSARDNAATSRGAADWPKNIGCCSSPQDSARDASAGSRGAADDWPKNIGCCKFE